MFEFLWRHLSPRDGLAAARDYLDSLENQIAAARREGDGRRVATLLHRRDQAEARIHARIAAEARVP